jgi:hypothetical protein
MATRRRASKSTLTGNITDLQRRVRYLQAKPVPSKLANQVVTRTAIQPRAVSTDQIALNAIANDQIQADAIRQEQLANLSVGNPELQDNAVLNRNINQDAVTAESIAINAVGSSEIADNAVGSGEIADNAVGSGEIADSAVGSSEIAMDAVTSNEIGPGAVGSNELATGAVITDKIENDQITKEKMKQNSVGSREIINGSVTTAQLSGGTSGGSPAVTNTKIADSAVTTAKLANGSVTSAKIANRTITTDNMEIPAFGRIVDLGLVIGPGIREQLVGSVIRIDPDFGVGTLNTARGNHAHILTIDNALSGLNRHTHTGRVTIPSTRRVKKDIESYTPDNIKNLLNLEPKRYKYKRSEREMHNNLNKEWMHGYIVEELVDLGFPEPASYDEEGAPNGLDYGLMSMLVLELVKVQQTEIDFLKEELLRLKDAE